MKLKEWVKSFLLPAFEKPEEVDLLLSASDLKEVEITDDVQKKIANKYMTLERAMADETIIKKFQKEARGMVFGSVDQKLKKFVPKLSQEDQDKINAETDTLLKLELLDKALDNLGSKPSDDIKKLQESFRVKEAELHKQLADLTTAGKAKETEFAKKLTDAKTDFVLRSKIGAVKLAPEFDNDKHKSFLIDSTIHNLRKSYLLELDETDQSTVHLRKNVDGRVTDVFEGNKKITLDDVLVKEFEPYVAKSSPGKNGGNGGDPPNPTPTPSTGPVTLRDMHRSEATN